MSELNIGDGEYHFFFMLSIYGTLYILDEYGIQFYLDGGLANAASICSSCSSRKFIESEMACDYVCRSGWGFCAALYGFIHLGTAVY